VVVLPIFVLLVGLGVINWLLPGPEGEGVVVAPTVAAGAVATMENPVGTRPLLGLATPWAAIGRGAVGGEIEEGSLLAPTVVELEPTLPGVGATPVNIPAGSVIQLLGPPDDGRFELDDDVSFYWKWPLALEANQRFGVYLRRGGDEWLLGAVERANMGSFFYLRARAADLVAEPAQYEWLVRLETRPVAAADGSTADTVVLAGSEARSLFLTTAGG
jgi:hypothetical protein